MKDHIVPPRKGLVDVATSALMALRFAPAETTRAYMETLRDYLDKYGRPLALFESANLWLSEFVKDYNSRFASIPRENGNAHRGDSSFSGRT